MPKPGRTLIGRVSGYADEAAAFMRRRRHHRRPFVRLYLADGRSSEQAAESEAGERLFDDAANLIELAGKRPRS